MFYVNVRHSDGTVFIRTYKSKQVDSIESVFETDNYAEAEKKAIQVANDEYYDLEDPGYSADRNDQL